MPARGIAVALLAVSLAFAQTKSPKAPTKAPAKAPVKAKAAPKAAAKAPAPAEPTRKLTPPKDESGRDKTFAAFLVRFKDVLKRKDRPGLTAMLAQDIDVGIRDMSGPGAFYTAWGLMQGDTAVYGVLTQILSLPGVWVEDRYCGPYVSVQFPPDLDRTKHQVILNPDVKLRATPSATGSVVATLAYEIVEVLEREEWTKVRTVAGKEGYVPIAYLYSPGGYRACFAKNAEGAWLLQSLAALR